MGVGKRGITRKSLEDEAPRVSQLLVVVHERVMSDIATHPLFPWMDMSKLFSNFRRIHPGNLPILGREYVGRYIAASIKCRGEIAGTCTHPRGTLH